MVIDSKLKSATIALILLIICPGTDSSSEPVDKVKDIFTGQVLYFFLENTGCFIVEQIVEVLILKRGEAFARHMKNYFHWLYQIYRYCR